MFSLNFMPQIVAPLAEQATNRESFTKAPIETPGMENVQPFLRAMAGNVGNDVSGRRWDQHLPESMQVPPARAGGPAAGLPQHLGHVQRPDAERSRLSLATSCPRCGPTKCRWSVASMPMSQPSIRNSRRSSMTCSAKPSACRAALRELDRQGRPDIADQKEQSPLAGEAKPLERANKNLQTLNAEMKDIRRATTWTPAEKRQRSTA